MPKKISLEEACTILGVNEQSSVNEIKREYRRLANIHHPDKTGSQEETNEFIKITQAYDTLKEKNNSNCFDLETFCKITSDPEFFMTWITDFIAKREPKRFESLAHLISKEDYKNAKEFYVTHKEQSLLEVEKVRENLLNNISKESYFDNNNLYTQIEALKFYANELKFDYDKSLQDISASVVSKLEKTLLEKSHLLYLDSESFEQDLVKKFDLIDKISLDTSFIEENFKNKLFEDALNLLKRCYNTERMSLSLDKIQILDDYFSPEGNANQLLEQSYALFLETYNAVKVGKAGLIPKHQRKYISAVLAEFGKRGIKEAFEKRKYLALSRQL